jgi:mxaA protein
MKTQTIKFIACIGLLLTSYVAIAQDNEIKTLKVVNPSQSSGVRIGDVLERQIEVQVSAPYQISRQALPLKGTVRDGIELSDIQVNDLKDGEVPGYLIKLRYRVFANTHVPTLMALPAEAFALTGGEKALSIKLPSWQFWFSPLVPADIKNVKEQLIPQFKPTLVDVAPHQQRLAVLLSMLIIGLAGLLYINADSRWLPFMNGAFARAHRKLKKLPRTQTSEKEALLQLHQAFNSINGANLFEGDIAGFLSKHPQFNKLKNEIEQFFQRSNQALFGEWQHDSAQFIGELIVLSKRLRDCERRVS